jgi:hypothetical protein
MTITACAGDLAQGYEALRAQAQGAVPGVNPRGRAVLVGAGLAAWMSALPPSARPRPPRAERPDRAGHQNGQSPELVRLLAEMVLASQARC